MVRALRSQDGADLDFQQIAQELQNGVLALEELQNLKLGDKYSQAANSIIAQAEQIKHSYLDILKAISKHHDTLGAKAVKTLFRTTRSKIQWVIDTRAKVERMRHNLEQQSLALVVLINRLQV